MSPSILRSRYCPYPQDHALLAKSLRQIIKGELNNEELLTSAIEGQDAVVSFLGPTKSLSARSIAPGTITNPYRVIFQAMRHFGVKRIFLMGTPSIHDPWDKSATIASLSVIAIKIFANAAYREIVSIGKLLDEEARDLDCTMFRLGFLSNSEGTISASYIGDKEWNIATFRPDAANWLVDQIGLEIPEHVQQRLALSSRKKMFPIDAADGTLNTALGSVKSEPGDSKENIVGNFRGLISV
jgi:hypothetical protein